MISKLFESIEAKNGTKTPTFSYPCLCLGNIVALSYISAQLMAIKTPLKEKNCELPKTKGT